MNDRRRLQVNHTLSRSIPGNVSSDESSIADVARTFTMVTYLTAGSLRNRVQTHIS